LPMLSLHDQSRGPWILLHVVSGPWTFFVAALDKGQCRKAVCRRYTYILKYSFRMDPNLFGMSLCTVDGQRYSLGHHDIK
jgi:hypothetical protein